MRLINIWVGILCAAGLVSANSLLVVPVSGETDRPADMATIDRLYRDALEADFRGTVLPVSNAGQSCADRECLADAARRVGADKVVYSTFSRLGSKWVFSSTLMKADASDAFNQRLTVSSVEEMETATQQMASALLNHAIPQQAENKGPASDKSEDKSSQSSHTLTSSGFAAGYFWPLGESFGHEEGSPPTFVQPHSQIVRLSWLNSWELPNNMLLDGDIVWGFSDASFGADANLNYIFNQNDFSPFLGGGLGLHWVFGDYVVSTTRQSGPAVNVQGGLFMFRNSDVHLMLRGEYQMIFNSDIEKLIAVDVGISVRKLDFWH